MAAGGRARRGARLAMMHASSRKTAAERSTFGTPSGMMQVAASSPRAQLALCAGTLRPKAKRQLAAELRVLEVRRPDKCR